MVLSNRAPKWAGAPTYSKAWRAIQAYQERPEVSDDMRALTDQLAVARTVSIRRDQMEPLPEWIIRDAAIMLSGPTGLPFPVTYFDLGGTRHPESQFKCHGALCVEGSESDVILPIWEGTDAKEWQPVMVGGVCRPTDEHPEHPGAFGLLDFGSEREGVEGVIGWASCLALSALDLVNSPGVELQEAKPSRSEKRKAVRSGGGISLTVVIQPPRARSASNGGGGKIEYSHRFERRAHAAFHPATSPMGRARPDLLREWPQKPGRLTRRVLVPATIVGPEDKPLVPKRRFLAPT